MQDWPLEVAALLGLALIGFSLEVRITTFRHLRIEPHFVVALKKLTLKNA